MRKAKTQKRVFFCSLFILNNEEMNEDTLKIPHCSKIHSSNRVL